jgi:hypothetical protein
MDQSFFLRAERMLAGSRPAPVDRDMLLATLAGYQSATRTAREEARARTGAGACDFPGEPLPEIILGGRGWREAAAMQGGCFNRAIAKQAIYGS